MRRQDIVRMFLFVVFFSIGAATLSISILCDDLLEYYHSKELLRAAEESLNRLKSLNTDYDILLPQLEEDPNLIERLKAAVLGTEREDDGTVYPKVTPEQLDAARKALTEDAGKQFAEPTVPGWLERCSEPRRKMMLFLSGAFLILISFMWFSSGKRASRDKDGLPNANKL